MKLKDLFHQHLEGFGLSPLTESMIVSIEKLLVKLVQSSQAQELDSFDEVRLQVRNTYTKSLDLEKMPCTSTALAQHIKRSYLQSNLWMTATQSSRAILSEVENYGWQTSDNDNSLYPVMLPQGTETRPSELPEPCTCKVCKFETRCACRVKKLKCCRYCKCFSTNGKGLCKNPYGN